MKPVSKTALYCCAVRMWDAELPKPFCGDQYARLFMTDEARTLMEQYRKDRYPNASNVIRHRLIDDLLREELARDPSRRIVLIGAGFDSRAFRLTGGRWVEVDEPQIIAHKEPRLPTGSSPNPLERISIEFATDSLADKLAALRGTTDVTVVIEGVMVYLRRAEIEALLATLAKTFPRHRLIADLVTATFIRRYGRGLRRRFEEMGAHFGELFEAPQEVILAAGYRVHQVRSIVQSSKDLGANPLPQFLLATVFRSLVAGYRLWEFES